MSFGNAAEIANAKAALARAETFRDRLDRAYNAIAEDLSPAEDGRLWDDLAKAEERVMAAARKLESLEGE